MRARMHREGSDCLGVLRNSRDEWTVSGMTGNYVKLVCDGGGTFVLSHCETIFLS